MASSRRRACLAEGWLSLVTSTERAAAIAGDLTEGNGGRTGYGFWLDLIRVSSALLLQGLLRASWRSLWLVCSGLVLWFSLYASIRAAGAAIGRQPLETVRLDCAAALPFSSFVYLAITLALSNLITGVIMGRRAPAGMLNACAPLAAFWAAAAVAALAATLVLAQPTWYCTALYLLGLPLLYILPLLYGAALGRRYKLA